MDTYRCPLTESPFTVCHHTSRVFHEQRPIPSLRDTWMNLTSFASLLFLARRGLMHQETSLQALESQLKLPSLPVADKETIPEQVHAGTPRKDPPSSKTLHYYYCCCCYYYQQQQQQHTWSKPCHVLPNVLFPQSQFLFVNRYWISSLS